MRHIFECHRQPRLLLQTADCGCHGQLFSLAHCKIWRWPDAAAARQVFEFHGQPFSLSHFKIWRWPWYEACAQAPLKWYVPFQFRSNLSSYCSPSASSSRTHNKLTISLVPKKLCIAWPFSRAVRLSIFVHGHPFKWAHFNETSWPLEAQASVSNGLNRSLNSTSSK